MTALLGLESVKRALQAKSYSIEQIYSEHALLWQQMEWDASQIRLWLTLATFGGLEKSSILRQ